MDFAMLLHMIDRAKRFFKYISFFCMSNERNNKKIAFLVNITKMHENHCHDMADRSFIPFQKSTIYG
jgi:hypothetical protein